METIDTLNKQAWELRHSNNLDEALSLANQALELAELANYQQGIAEGLLTISYCQFRRSSFKEALENASKAEQLFKTSGHKTGRQKALNTLGIIHGQSGNIPEALKTFLQAHKLCEGLNDQEAEANALNNLAIIYVYLGDYSTALDYYLKSLSIYQNLGIIQGEIKTLQNLGVVYFELDKAEEALGYFQKSLELLGDGKDAHTYALNVINIGRTYSKLGQPDKALEYQLKGLELMEELQDKSGVAITLDELGRTYLLREQLQEAQASLSRSLIIKRELDDSKGQAETCLHLGTFYSQQDHYHEAVEVLQQGLAMAHKVSAKAEIYRIHHLLAKAHKALGRFQEAFEHLEQYIDIKDELFNSASDQRFQALRVSHEVEQAEKEREIYRLRSVEMAKANAELQHLTDQLERQAKEDPLTKLYNRRHFDAVLSQEYERALRYNGKLSVLICDIDNFKKVNDTFSHQTGDEVLIKVAGIFKENVRRSDVVARYGGEEFVILFPETSAQNAFHICDKLRKIVEAAPWHEIHPDLRVTISMGLCDDIGQGSGETMIARADDKLYEVKRNGKNHVRIWESSDIVGSLVFSQ